MCHVGHTIALHRPLVTHASSGNLSLQGQRTSISTAACACVLRQGRGCGGLVCSRGGQAKGSHVGIDVDQDASTQQHHLLRGEGEVQLAAHVVSHLCEAMAGQHIRVDHHMLLHPTYASVQLIHPFYRTVYWGQQMLTHPNLLRLSSHTQTGGRGVKAGVGAILKTGMVRCNCDADKAKRGQRCNRNDTVVVACATEGMCDVKLSFGVIIRDN